MQILRCVWAALDTLSSGVCHYRRVRRRHCLQANSHSLVLAQQGRLVVNCLVREVHPLLDQLVHLVPLFELQFFSSFCQILAASFGGGCILREAQGASPNNDLDSGWQRFEQRIRELCSRPLGPVGSVSKTFGLDSSRISSQRTILKMVSARLVVSSFHLLWIEDTNPEYSGPRLRTMFACRSNSIVSMLMRDPSLTKLATLSYVA